MSLRKLLLACLLGLVALAGAAAATSGPACPECDEDGDPDDSWYASYDTGVVSDDAGVLQDTDASVGENDSGQFTWLQYCLKFWDVLGNEIVIRWEAFVSEDGTDLDGSVSVNGEETDLEDTLVGDLDDATWGAMPDMGADLPSVRDAMPDLGGLQDVDECVYPDDLPDARVSAEATASCDVAVG